MNPARLSIAEAGKLMRQGKLTSVALVRDHLDLITDRQPRLNAFVHLDAEGALARAEVADAELAEGTDRGLLHGIPVALKDMIDTVDEPTQYGSRLFAGHRPARDADCVGALKAAGAVILGKVATYEFATVGPSFDTPFPPALNPWDLGAITGGSSSGSASAVAGGLVRLAIGTDTGGSVRSPASYCGIVGFKPAFGSISKRGVFPLSPSLDHVGILSGCVRDSAMGFAALTGQPLEGLLPPESPAAINGLTIGYARDWFAHDTQLQPGLLPVLDTAVSMLSLLGGQVREIGLSDYQLFEAAGAAILHAEAFAAHKERLAARGREYGVKAFRTLLAGAALSEGDVALARKAQARLRHEMDQALGSLDVMVTACTLTTAPRLKFFEGHEAVWTPMRTLGFNLTGHPALVVPCGHLDGLPLGLQLIGREGEEKMLFQLAEAFEMATDHMAITPSRPR